MVERLIERDGQLFAHYAGPWRGTGPGKRTNRIDHNKPHRLIEAMFADGRIDTTDKPIVHNGAVYLRYR